MSELIANDGMQISATSLGAWIPGDPNLPVDMSLVKTPADAADCPDGEDVLTKEISWTVVPAACVLAGNTHVGGSSSPILPPGPGTGAPIEATAQKVKCKALGSPEAVLRKGDTGKCNGSFTLNVSPFTTTYCQCDFEITDANQTKAKAE